MKVRVGIFVAVSLLFSSAVSADLIMSAPPREHAGQGDKTYGPLAARLSEVLGEKVVYQQPESWAEYTNKLQNDKYDIIFDGPHFMAWRIKHIDNQAVARLPGHLAFHIITKNSDKHLTSVHSLRSARVCAFASPNLTSMVLLDQFRNEVVIPSIVAVRGNMGDILKELDAGKCDAAVVRDQFYDKAMSAEQRDKYRIVFTSRQFPNQGISVSRRVDAGKVSKIASLLMQGDTSLKPITQRFAKKAKKFVDSNNADYKGINKLLEGVVWGW